MERTENNNVAMQTTCVSGFVSAPIEKVWEVFSDFNPTKWWKIYTKMEVYEENGQVFRHFVVRGIEMKEKRAFQDDANHEQKYQLVSASPSVGIKDAMTTVKMYSVGSNTTLISWCAEYLPILPQYSASIHASQTQAFEGAIHSLSQQFDSSLTLQDFILPLKHNFLGLLRDLIQTTQQEPHAKWEYTSMGEHFIKFPKQLKGLNFHSSLQPEKNALLIRRVNEFGVDLLLSYGKQRIKEESYDLYFQKFLTRPDCAKHWKDDHEFCKQFLQGANPMLIEVVQSVEKLPVEFHALRPQNKSMQELVAAKQIFCVDYKLLIGIPPAPGMVIYAPFVVLQKEHGSSLKVVGITLTREKDKANTVYTPTSQPNKYLYAKILVACADSQLHEFLFHLGYTHLAMEPLAIATHNVLEMAHHPLGYLLAPHFRDTIGINYVARQTLVSHQGAFTDKTFSLGFHGGIKLILNGFENYSLKNISFPKQLRDRGFDEKKRDGLDNILTCATMSFGKEA